MLGALIGSVVLLLGIAIAALLLLRGWRLKKRRRRRVHVAVAVSIAGALLLIAGLHRLSPIHLSIIQTNASTSSNHSCSLREAVELGELLAFRNERTCPDHARALCDRLELPSDTALRVTSFRLEEGRCGLPLADTIKTRASVELELTWLRAGAYKTATFKTSAVVVANAYGLYGCGDVREPAIARLAEKLSRDIGEEVPEAPLGVVQDVTALTYGWGKICTTLADRTVRCLGAHSLLTMPKGLKATELGVAGDAVCALDAAGALSCSVWDRGNVEPKPARKICDVPGLRKLTVNGGPKLVICGVDAEERGACVEIDPTGESDCAAIERAFADGRRGVREIVSVGSYTCTLATDGIISCGAGRLPPEMRRAEHIRAHGALQLCTLSAPGIVRCAYPHERLPEARLRTAEFPGVMQFAADLNAICAVVPPGRVRCEGSTELPSDPFPELSDAVDIAVDRRLVCALTARRSLMCTHGASSQPPPGLLAATGLAVRPSADRILDAMSAHDRERAKSALTKPFTLELR